MNDERIDELRQRLRALGYLDAGVDRFVLAPARGSRGPVALAARASVRVGLLGGVLLGPAAAVGVGARVPGLVSGVRDAAVLAVYLAVLFCGAIATLAFVMSIAAAQTPRPAGRVPRAAGWLTTIASLAYLTLWWRNANAGFGWNAGWTAFALAVAVSISLLLGHAVRTAALGVLAAGRRPDALPRQPSTSWGVLAAGGAVAFGGAAVLLVATTSADTRAAGDAPRLTVVGSRAPIRLIAVDGLDPATYARLAPSLPHLRSVLGGRRAALQPQDTSDPARAWTTVATGMPPGVHGVHAIEMRRVAGLRGVLGRHGRVAQLVGAASDLARLTRPSLVSREQRQAKTIWEVAEDAGLRTAVVNWWATWPAPSNGGIVVTDRAVLRLERGGALDGEIEPPGVYESLRTRWPAIRAGARDAAARAFADGGDPQVTALLRRSAELDAAVAATAEWLASRPLDLCVVYFPGLDIAQNALLGPSAGAPLSASLMASRVDALGAYYPVLDAILAPLVAPAAGVTTIVVTQPGRVQPSVGGILAIRPPPGTASRPDDGSLAAERAGAEPDAAEPAAAGAPLDVAPTVWWALGLPVSRELRGAARTELVGVSKGANVRYVDSYGRPLVARERRRGRPLDQEMIDRLRSLGYVK